MVVSEKSYPDLPSVVVPSARRALCEYCAEYYGHPEKKLKIIGVTGTNGKTTTAYLIYQMYQKIGVKSAFVGTLGAFVDDETFETGMTTPDTPEFFRILDLCVRKSIDVVVCEVSAHAIYYEKLWNVPFRYGVFTNLSQDHLDFFHTMEEYSEIKKRWLSSDGVECAVLPMDPFAESIGLCREKESVYYGVDFQRKIPKSIVKESTIRYLATDCRLGEKTSFTFIVDGKTYAIESPLVGEFNLKNLLAAMTVLVRDGAPIENVQEIVLSVKPAPGRFTVAYKGDFTIVVDYAHTPDGLEKVLTAARGLTKGKLYCVFGCGGNRDKIKRPIMGRVATTLTDYTILTSDNPRDEDPRAIIKEIESGIDKGNYAVVVNREEAIECAINRLQKGDLLVVAGKGSEGTMEVCGKFVKFSDFECIKKHIIRIKI